MKCEVVIDPGRLPAFWDRNAVFAANLLSLFYGNQGETERLCEEVGNITTYGGRLVPIIDLLFRGAGRNLLVLESEADPLLLEYYTDACGLTVPDQLILPHEEYLQLHQILKDDDQPAHDAFTTIARHEAEWMDGFVTDAVLTLLAKRVGKQLITTESGSKQGNNKLALHRFLEQRGHPVFDTHEASDPDRAWDAVRRLARQGYQRAVIKAQIGASGIGMIQLDTDSARTDMIPDYLFYEGPCLVQGWLDETAGHIRRVGSPSVQMFVNQTKAHLYDLTEQILSASSVHEGNLAPPPYILQDDELRHSIFDQAADAARWLHECGYRGTASADFLVVEIDRQPRVILCEINARVTGATYPAVLARHLCPGDAWLLRNLRFKGSLPAREILTRLDRHGFLYKRGRTSGMIPINVNRDDEQKVVKGQFLCLAPQTEDCMAMILATQGVLPVQWEYDRD